MLHSQSHSQPHFQHYTLSNVLIPSRERPDLTFARNMTYQTIGGTVIALLPLCLAGLMGMMGFLTVITCAAISAFHFGKASTTHNDLVLSPQDQIIFNKALLVGFVFGIIPFVFFLTYFPIPYIALTTLALTTTATFLHQPHNQELERYKLVRFLKTIIPECLSISSIRLHIDQTRHTQRSRRQIINGTLTEHHHGRSHEPDQEENPFTPQARR